MKQLSDRTKTGLRVFLAGLLILCGLAALFLRQGEDIQDLTPVAGTLDARAADFNQVIYEVGEDWAHYPLTLASTGAELEGLASTPHDSAIPYATYRLEMQAQPGQYLMLAGWSMDYSTRVYLNGTLVREVGTVADNAEASEPRIDYMLLPLYTGEDGQVEIVLQYANFVHKSGGHVPAFFLSAPENIQQMQERQDLYALTLGGGLCLFGLYFLLLAAMQRQVQYGLLALTCVLMGLRNQNFYVVHLLPGDYDWSVAYRFLVWMILMQVFAQLMLLASIYRPAVGKWAVRVYVALYGVLTLLCFALPTQQIADLTEASQWVSGPFLVYLVVCLLRKKSIRFHREDALVLGCYVLLLLAMAYEAEYEQIISAVTRSGTAPPAMLLFVLLLAVAVGLRTDRQQAAWQESRRQRDMLAQLNQLKNDFLQQMAHELKTPLTVMSGYAQLTRWQMEQDAVDESSQDHLHTISTEAQRLSALVSQLIRVANGEGRDTAMEPVCLDKLFEDAAQVCVPLLEKHGNRLVCQGGEGVRLLGNHGMLLQVLLNLTINANKHTRRGVVTYSAAPGGAGMVCLRVEDTGEGIPPEVAPHVFDKGYSTDGGSGIGLYICQDVAKLHGGQLTLEHTGPGGTVFCLELPEAKEEGSCERSHDHV